MPVCRFAANELINGLFCTGETAQRLFLPFFDEQDACGAHPVRSITKIAKECEQISIDFFHELW